MKYLISAIGGLLMFGASALAGDWGAPPLSVVQDDVLNGGQVRGSYIYTNEQLSGDAMGSHGLRGAFGVTNNLTFSAESAYLDNFSDGFTDIFLNVTLDTGELLGFSTRVAIGGEIPIGFDELRSAGAFNLRPAVTIWDDEFIGPVGFGAQYSASIALDRNDLSFALGDRHSVKGWLDIAPSEQFNIYALICADFVGRPTGETVHEFDLFGSTDLVQVGAGVVLQLDGLLDEGAGPDKLEGGTQ